MAALVATDAWRWARVLIVLGISSISAYARGLGSDKRPKQTIQLYRRTAR